MAIASALRAAGCSSAVISGDNALMNDGPQWASLKLQGLEPAGMENPSACSAGYHRPRPQIEVDQYKSVRRADRDDKAPRLTGHSRLISAK